MTSNFYVSKWVFTPIENNHTGIKYVRNWESDLSADAKPCFRCYLSSSHLCEWCKDEIAPRTICSWEQFKINANWKYFPEKKCPKSATEFYKLTWRFGDPKQTYKNFIKSHTHEHNYLVTFPQKTTESEKDRKEYQKYIRISDFYDSNWRKKEMELIPIPVDNQRRSKKSQIFNIICNVILS